MTTAFWTRWNERIHCANYAYRFHEEAIQWPKAQ